MSFAIKNYYYVICFWWHFLSTCVMVCNSVYVYVVKCMPVLLFYLIKTSHPHSKIMKNILVCILISIFLMLLLKYYFDLHSIILWGLCMCVCVVWTMESMLFFLDEDSIVLLDLFSFPKQDLWSILFSNSLYFYFFAIPDLREEPNYEIEPNK